MSTEEQLGHLRRQIRRQNQALALVAILAVSAVLLGAAMQTTGGEMVLGKFFAVKDENGKTRMILGKDGLFFLDPNGKPRVALKTETGKNEASFALIDPTSGEVMSTGV